MSDAISENGFIDHQARSMASEAIQLIKSHDRVCDERWRENGRRWEEAARLFNGFGARSEEQLKEIKDALKAIERSYSSRFWMLAMSVIGVLMTISGFLIVKVLFHG